MAQEITTSVTIAELAPNAGRKKIVIETPSTTDTGDTIVLTLATYGATTLLGITGWSHTTANSVVVGEAPTTAVSAGVLTITTGGSGNTDKVRVYEILLK